MIRHKGELLGRSFWGWGAAFMFLAGLQACAPYRVYRAPLPPPPQPSAPYPQAAPAPGLPESGPRPVLRESKIGEENLEARQLPPVEPNVQERQVWPAPSREIPPVGRETNVPSREMPSPERPAPLPERAAPPPAPAPEGSLIAMITPSTPPRRAISLRMTEEGRKYLEAGDYPKALARLEKTIRVDSSNPYGYYYLAQTHHRMGRFQESLNFLDVAESLFAGDSHWLAEVFALKGENFRALGFSQRADSSYSKALELNPDNRTAIEGMNQLRSELPAR